MIMKRQKILRLYLGRDSEKNNGDHEEHKRHENIENGPYIKKPKGRIILKDRHSERSERTDIKHFILRDYENK